MVIASLTSNGDSSGSAMQAGAPASSAQSDADRAKRDSVRQASARAAHLAAAKTFAALRDHCKCTKDSLYDSEWLTHRNQADDGAYARTFLAANLHTSGTVYLQSHYTGDDWIFHHQVIVKVGGRVIESEIIPSYSSDNNTDNSGGRVWERIHFTKGRDNGILDAIAANPDSNVMVRYEGREHRADRTLGARDRVAIAESVRLARAIKQLGPIQCAMKPDAFMPAE